MIMSGNEAWKGNDDGRLIDRDEADFTLSSRLFQMVGPATGKARPDGRQFHGRYQQTIGPSRAEGTSTRQIGDTNQLVRV